MSKRDALKDIKKKIRKGQLPKAARECMAVLRSEPQNIEAIELYGDIAMRMERTSEAIVVFQKLLAIEPNHRGAHESLASIFYHNSDHFKAKTHAQTALKIDARRSKLHTILGAIAFGEGKTEEAEQAFQTARKISPNEPAIEQIYIDGLLTAGKFEEAAQALREQIKKHPRNSSLYVNLARCQKLDADNPDVLILRGMLSKDGKMLAAYRSTPDQKVAAHLALSKLESDLGNPELAFEYLQTAKDIRKEKSPFDTEAAGQHIARTKEIFSASFFAEKFGLGSSDDSPIFVLGMPRSGTTLLERILSRHEHISAVGELSLVDKLGEMVCARYGENQYDDSGLLKAPDSAWQELGDEYVRRVRMRGVTSKFFIDKMPSNYLHLGLIKAMLPQAKVIHLSRHPVATCLSIYEQDFISGHGYGNDLRWLGTQYLQYREIMDYWKSLLGSDIIEVSYEAMVADEEATLGQLGDQLDVNLDAQSSELDNSSGKILTASFWQARQGIHTNSVARWEKLKPQLQPLLQTLEPILANE